MSGFAKDPQPVYDRKAEGQREGIRRELERIGDALTLIALERRSPAGGSRTSIVAHLIEAKIVSREDRLDARGRPT